MSEESLGGGGSYSGDRAATHAAPAFEKASHARFKSAVQRALSRPTDCVIADACNLTKGFRYELHILARNAGTPSCCLWVGPDVPLGSALGVNRARGDGCGSVGGSGATAYAEGALRDLWARFEAPDARNRWDAPLLRLPLLGLSRGGGGAALLAAAAARVQLVCGREHAGGGMGGGGWWEEARWGAAAPAAAGPFLTSRFALSATHAAGALAAARGAGGVVEDLGASAQKALRQVADAAAGYGAAPLRGFSARGGGGVARGGRAPDYFAEDFNGDGSGSEEEGGGGDVGNLRDFEGMDGGCTAGEEASPAPAPAPPARSCFRKAAPATAPLPLPPPAEESVLHAAPVAVPAEGGLAGAAQAQHAAPQEPLKHLQAWLAAWLRGEKPPRTPHAAEECANSAEEG